MSLYLDWNATTPLLPEALEAMHHAAKHSWGNPSSVHAHGRTARAVVEEARLALAQLAQVDPREILWTSGGTEANNLALRTPFAHAPGVLVTSRLEHPSVTRVAEQLEREGRAQVRWLRVEPRGTIDLEDLEKALQATQVTLLALQAVNHETGVLQPLAEAMVLAQRYGTRVHVDAVQSWGRLGVPTPGADSYSVAGHKIRGPKGIGALVLRPSYAIHPLLLGGAQERGLRPGTLDPVAAAGLAVALRHAQGSPARYHALAPLRDRLEEGLLTLPGAVRHGTAPRAPHVSNLSFPGWPGSELVAALDLEGVSISSGSACSAGTIEPSPVLCAMVGREQASRGVRVSLGEETTAAEIERALATFHRVLMRSAL